MNVSHSGVVHVGSLFGAGGDRVVFITWRKRSGGVTLDGESGWQKWGWWEGPLGLLACRRSLWHLREYSVAHLLREPKQSSLLPGPVCAGPKSLCHVGGGGHRLNYVSQRKGSRKTTGRGLLDWSGLWKHQPDHEVAFSIKPC